MRFFRGIGWIAPRHSGPALPGLARAGRTIFTTVYRLAFWAVFFGFLPGLQAQNRAEYFFDTDPGIGSGTSLTLPAGDSVVLVQSVPTSSLATGFHTLFLRTRMGGRWSQAGSQPFFIASATSLTGGPVTELEYFFDTDPGIGSGIKLAIAPATDSSVRTATIPISALSTGFHTLFVRAKNNRGYSLTESRTFFIANANALSAGPIFELEYFFDTDPGIGLGSKVAINPAADSSSRNVVIPVTSLTAGFHTLYVRARNNTGYSFTESRTFFIVSQNALNGGPVTQLEYFFDTDPGIGSGTKLAISNPADSVERTAAIPVTGLSSGFHNLYIRARNNQGTGHTEVRSFFILPNSTFTAGPVRRMEYFIDTDPGFGNGTPISAFSAADSADLTRTIVLPTSITFGTHKLYVRSQSTDLRWSLTEEEEFTVACGETEVSATQSQVCPGLSTVLSFTSGNIPGTYQWFRNGQLLSGANQFNLTVNQPGTYQLLYSNGTCSDTSAGVVIGTGTTTLASLTPSGPQEICSGGSVVFQANTGTGLTYLWLRNNVLQFGSNSSFTASTSGSYSVVVTNSTGCKDTSDAVAVSIAPGPGDPSVFPQDSWTLYAYNGTDINLSNPSNYLGFYTVSGLSVSTDAQWPVNGSPSSAAGYQGCNVPTDNFSFSLKRKGFPPGPYTLSVTGHDDNLAIFLNGTQLTLVGCCNTNPTLTLGNLDANSSLELRLVEGAGAAFLAFNLQLSTLSGGTIGTNQTLCSGATPAAFTNTVSASGGTTATITYQWQDSTDGGSWQNITNATNPTFQASALTADRWYRRKAINASDEALSNAIKMTIVTPVGDPAIVPVNSWNLYAYSGQDLGLGSGLSYKGFYPLTGLGVNTPSQWAINLSPSAATGYQGCPVENDNFTFVLKRKGFPSGSYLMNVLYHDDFIQVLVNGIGLGNLDENSIVEVRVVEGGGSAGCTFTLETTGFQPGTIGSDQTLCSGTVPNLLESLSEATGGANIAYQWQDSTIGGTWQNIANATNPSFQPGSLTATRFYRRRASSGSLFDFSNRVQITVLPVPTADISPSGPIVVCEGTLVTLSGSVSTGATRSWLRNETVLNGQSGASLVVTLSGTYKLVARAGTCTDTSQAVSVVVNPVPNPVVSPAGPITLCSGLSTTLTLTNPQSGQTVQWKNAGDPISGGNSISVSAPGFYYPVVTISATGCKGKPGGESRWSGWPLRRQHGKPDGHQHRQCQRPMASERNRDRRGAEPGIIGFPGRNV
jgi:hypothetical protein